MPGFPCESRDHWQVRQTIKEERARADAVTEEYQEQPRLPDGFAETEKFAVFIAIKIGRSSFHWRT